MYNWKIGIPTIYSTSGTNDINRTPSQKEEQTNISLSVLSSQSKNKSDTLSNTVVMENEKIDTNNVPIGIPTIQKSVPKSAGTMSTKNNVTSGNKKEKSSSSGKISSTGKNHLLIWLIWMENLIPRK